MSQGERIAQAVVIALEAGGFVFLIQYLFFRMYRKRK